jgi:hypothetical protein
VDRPGFDADRTYVLRGDGTGAWTEVSAGPVDGRVLAAAIDAGGRLVLVGDGLQVFVGDGTAAWASIGALPVENALRQLRALTVAGATFLLWTETLASGDFRLRAARVDGDQVTQLALPEHPLGPTAYDAPDGLDIDHCGRVVTAVEAVPDPAQPARTDLEVWRLEGTSVLP